jgi:hypothetical protein
VDGKELLQHKGLGGDDRQAASAKARFAKKRHGQIPFS